VEGSHCEATSHSSILRVCMAKTELVTLVVVLLAWLGPIATHMFLALSRTYLGFNGYRVKHSKACRANQHAIELLWGDLERVYNQVPGVWTGCTQRLDRVLHFLFFYYVQKIKI
jgi:hypothetical protein